MKPLKPRHKIALITLGIAALGATAALFSSWNIQKISLQNIAFSPQLSFVDNVTQCSKTRSRAEQNNCYDSLFTSYLAKNSPETLLKNFSGAIQKSPEIRRDCHQIAHAMGRATLVRLQNIEAVFRMDRTLDVCAGGFFHGAIEKLFRPTDDVPKDEHVTTAEFAKKIPALCDQFEKVNRRAECIHGIGHGALFLFGDIGPALKACELLPVRKDRDDRFACYSGVFMEYEISGQAKNDNARDPQFPCSDYQNPYQNACYYVHSFRLTNLGLNKTDAVAECRKAPNPANIFCLRGYGIFYLAHEALADGFQPIVDFCETLPSNDSRICAEAVASRLASLRENGKDALPFCGLFKNTYIRSRCFSYTIDVLRLAHKVPLDSIRADCNNYLRDPAECLKALDK